MTHSARRPRGAACLLALAGLGATLGPPATGAERAPVRNAARDAPVETEARVIVKFKAASKLMRALSASANAAPPQHAQALSARLGLALIDGRAIGERAQVIRARGIGSRDLAERLAAQGDVEYAVVDGRMRALAAPNDPLYAGGQTGAAIPAAGQWYLRAPTSSVIVDATSVVASINAEAAWDVTPGSSSVVVAVIDTGVRLDHPDLAGKLRPGYDFISDAATAIDGDGRDSDPSDPGDHGCIAGELSNWHGTQTTGLVGAATNNGIGIAGAGRNVMLLPVRVLGRCGGFDSDIQAAMLWSAGLSSNPSVNPFPAKVVNLSLGSTGGCSAGYMDVLAQLNRAGVTVVAAAGNDGIAVGTPANCPGVIAVAGVRHAGTKVGYSDLGSEISIAAPAGNCVNLVGDCLFPLMTTSNRGTTTAELGAAGAIYTGSGANRSIGTSFSAPLVAGTVGLMLSAHPALKPSQVSRALRATARAFPASGAPPIQLTSDPNAPFVPVVACTAPTSTPQENECYCTTSTCGAGLLDAGQAVAAQPMVAAGISAAPTTVLPGDSIALDGAVNSGAGGSATIDRYDWSITSGTGAAVFSSATNAATATLLATGAGSVVVGLTVTDSAGRQDSASVTLSVVSTTPLPEPAPAGSTSGGGGAIGLGWLFGWMAAIFGVWRVTPRRRGA